MKIFTVLVNGRVDHIVNFDSSQRTADNYVVQNNGGKVKLLGFYKEADAKLSNEVIFQTDKGSSLLLLKGLTCEMLQDSTEPDLVNCTMKVSLVPKDEDSVDKGGILSDEIDNSYWEDKKSQIVFNAESTKRYHIKVVFYAIDPAISNSVMSRELEIFLVPKKYIHDIVLDYGSEASQLLVYSRKDGQRITINNNVPLFNLFLSNLTGDMTTASDYLQRDPDSDYFFKTNFLASKSPTGDSDPCVAIKANPNVKFLTKVDEVEGLKNDYLTIPNIKVAGHGGVTVPTISVDGIPKDIFTYGDRYFYRALINSFLQQAFRYVKDGNVPAYFNVYLLMPNVYTQEDITRNLLYVSDDIRKMSSVDGGILGFDFIKGVETSSVSESDASFIGFMSQLPTEAKVNMPEGRYLVIDAGKGTTDFSIIHYSTTQDDTHHMYNSIFRSGIIGAGNAITYSFLLAILKDIYKSQWPTVDDAVIESDISTLVKTKITTHKADESLLCNLMKLLDEYKILYNENMLLEKSSYSHSLMVSTFNDISLEGIINCLQNMVTNKYKISDMEYVENMMDSLAFDIAMKIKSSYGNDPLNKIAYVVFAGRGFLMAEFKNRVLSMLKTVNPTICGAMREKPLTVYPQQETSASYKNLCMYVIGALTAGKYNGRLVGTPQIITKDDFADFLPNQEEEEEVEKENNTKKISSMLGKATKFFAKLLLPEDSVDYEDLSLVHTGTLNNKLVNGFKANVRRISDQIVFSGVSYSIPIDIRTGLVEIFFDGYEFVVRQEGNSVVSRFESIVSLEAEHIFESTFPYCQTDNNRSIPFPKAPVFLSDIEDKNDVDPDEESPFDDDDQQIGPEHEDSNKETSDLEEYGSEDEALLREIQ